MPDDASYELKCCKWITIVPGRENICPVCKSVFVVTKREPEDGSK